MGSKLVREGKSKRVYLGEDNETLVLEFKDSVTAFDGARKDVLPGKGVLNARISAYLFKILEEQGIPTHYIDYDGCRRLVVKKLDMIPVEVVVRNYAYGSLLKRMPLYKRLEKLEPPLLEFHLKDDALHDPLILPEDMLRTGLLSNEELGKIRELALKATSTLTKLFEKHGLMLIDIKLEFGRDRNGELVLADEITGDSFRVMVGGKHLDKEVYRKGGSPQDLLQAYLELAERLGLGVSIDELRC